MFDRDKLSVADHEADVVTSSPISAKKPLENRDLEIKIVDLVMIAAIDTVVVRTYVQSCPVLADAYVYRKVFLKQILTFFRLTSIT